MDQMDGYFFFFIKNKEHIKLKNYVKNLIHLEG